MLSPFIKELLNEGINELALMMDKQDKWKNRIRDDWQYSKKLPRKKKKALRKKLLLEWSLACYDPFNFSREDLILFKKAINY